MKKGCFLTAIITITILVGVVFYVIKNHGEVFENFAKEKVLNAASRDLDKELKDIDPSEYKDSLKVVFNDFIKEIKNEKFEKAMHNFSSLVNEIKIISEDHKVDSLEFKAFKILVERYERSKKN